MRFSLLGGFHVAHDQISITRFGGDKVQALLAYLVIEAERPHTRAALAGLLWPNFPDAIALRNLSQSLVRLRAAFGDQADALLAITRQTIQWRADADVDVDVTTFARLSRSTQVADLEAATELYTGGLLAGFGLADCEAFEEWLLLTREQLHLQVLAAYERLADLHHAAARHAQSIAAARQLLAMDPWRETAYRQLMRGLAATGDRASALAAYERCRQMLHDSFGALPDLETSALAAQIRQEHGGPADTVVRAASLPVPLTPLIGRADDLAMVSELLQHAARLVTVLGSGGIGKTRLALAAAHSLRTMFPDSVCWVELAGVSGLGDQATQRNYVIGAILDALQHRQRSQRPPLDELCALIQQRTLLLVLDNCEHLSAVSGLIHRLLTTCPALRILATSRERLGIAGEELVVLDGLPVSDSSGDAQPLAAAVQLFLARAQQQVRSFGSDMPTLQAVVRLCRLLEGMPLAIELAAHWVGDYTPDEMIAAVRDDMTFLQTRDHDRPDRQRSVRAVFGYSWRLLSTEERRTLARLSIFEASFDRSAAMQVAEARPATLAALVDKSLLRRVGVGRYSMHTLLRQFAAEQLDATVRAAVEARHGTYYLAFVAARARRLGRDQPREAATEIQREIENVRQAWSWAVAETRATELAQAAYGWWQFCLLTGQDSESRHMFGLAVARLRSTLDAGGVDAPSRQQQQRGLSILLAIHANHLFSNAPYEQMAAEAREAIRLGAESAGMEGETLGHFVLGRALQELGQQGQARAMRERTIQLARAYQPLDPSSELLHEAEWLAYTWLFGSLLFFEDYAGGRACVVESLRISQSLHKRRAELFSLASLAMIDFYLGDDLSARQRYEQVIPLARALDDQWAEMRVQRELSEVLLVQGEYAQADTLLGTVVATARAIGIGYEEILALAALVRLHCQLGDTSGAASWREQLIQRMDGTGVTRDCQAEGLRACAVYALYSGDHQQALADAEQAWEIAEQIEIPNFRADSAVILGHARAGMQQPEAAAAAYQQAVALYSKIGNAAMASEPQAGLAQLALAQGDHIRAQTLVELLLPMLAERPRARVHTPFYAYLIGYRVLKAANDPRAASVLLSAYAELRRWAATISDSADRQRFIQQVASHHEIAALAEHELARTLRNREPAIRAEEQIYLEGRSPSKPPFSGNC